MGQVLGVSVTDLQVASVIMEAETGNVLARNTADLADATPESVLDAITQLVETVPFEVESITVACAQRSTQVALHNTITAGASGDPAWYRTTIVTDTPFAFANVAAAQSDQRGQVVVIDLADDAVPFNELSIAAVDTETATVVGAIQLPGGGRREPVTEPSGAVTVSEAFRLLPATEAGRTGVFVVGPGASVPGVAAALEYETQLPVQIAEAPIYSAAHGAALHGRTRLRSGAARNRWFILVGAALAALILAVVVVIVVLVADDEKSSPTPASPSSSTTTTTTPTTTSSRPASTPRSTTPTTQTQDEAPETTQDAPPVPQQTVTVTPPRQTVTRTATPPPTSSSAPVDSGSQAPPPDNGSSAAAAPASP
ncbi:hypothetical protein [Williamsia deligens]|uniref:DUF7159 domain-containing protein n=1 Tax=Williamsia deligens TaxID=321325 RepID=A0ABW3G399_9NOCA|nr:hypothetical protein [Williamsia deligens]MCP2194214.1 hypothetical protein [Williamsia deligens]